MIQAIGLTSAPRRRQRPAVDDLTFEARSGRVTVLLGPEGAGKTSALRLLLQLCPGRGVALFNGRPVYRVPHPAREIGVLLGDVPGHPARTARGHLRMLTAVVGVPAERADEVLDVVGLSGLADQKLGTFSLGMDRRLGMATALLGDPHTLVLDEPTHGLSPRETAWLHGLLRGYAEQGGAVLVTSRDPREAARVGDRVVSVEEGRLVADQSRADFARTRLRPRVAVRTPHADRFALLLSQEARAADRTVGQQGPPMEVVHERGSRISVYGSSCAEVGDVAHRNGILVHQLADEIGDAGDSSVPAPLNRADGRRTAVVAASRTTEENDPVTVGTKTTTVARVASPARVAVGSGATTSRLDTAAPSVNSPSTHGSSDSVTPTEASSAVSVDVAAIPDTSDAEDSSSTEDTSAAAKTDAPEADAPTSGDATCDAACTTESTDEKPVPDGAGEEQAEPGESATETPGAGEPVKAGSETSAVEGSPLPPRLHAVPRPGPAAPLLYELRRLAGVRTTWLTSAAAVLVALVGGIVLARTGAGLGAGATGAAGDAALSPVLRLLTGWPGGAAFVVPPAAVAAGFLGALAFGHEFRYPALAPAQAPVPRRLGLLLAKLLVSAGLAVALCLATAVVNGAALTVLFGSDVLKEGAQGAAAGLPLQAVAVALFTVGCSWAGLLAAGVFRSTAVGTAAVVAIPLLVTPAVRGLLSGPAGRSLEGLPDRLAALLFAPWPSQGEGWVAVAVRLASQPAGRALALSLTVLLCVYVFTSLRSRAR
ncbi:ATP-binding cassette domain-containing protein [Streptomyces sp. HNM0574]|uniref:ABC transporter ATP-binding protein n=1 Tax=Streptomyces sp. HNM0574 TaxID=2714954 RepID=UPI00146F643B|nr:ATP-binding cassette domain-containing protein [Streptomyces sp. HNM0574]NLU65727.1 ATP-binding cassette domain-containing protein [Streptomyces sp. HNM0574]